jgi:hypothetical protein
MRIKLKTAVVLTMNLLSIIITTIITIILTSVNITYEAAASLAINVDLVIT